MKYIVLKLMIGIGVLGLSACSFAGSETLETDYMTVKLNDRGQIVSFVDKSTGKDYMAPGESSALLTLYDGKEYIEPLSLQSEPEQLILRYPNQSEVVISKEIKNGYIRLSLVSLSERDSIQAVVWGPYATSFSQYIGETIGVVRDTSFAVGMQALDIFTIEGVPDQGDDASGGTFIDPLPGQKIPDELKDQIGKKIDFINVNVEGDMPDYVRNWRGNAATKQPSGSTIQLFARDWRIPRIVNLYGRKQMVEPKEQDFIGSAIALFGCPAAKTLDVIEQIELGEGLPHPMIDGVWLKRWDKANQAYMLYEGTNMDQAMNYADSCNFKLMHIGDFFKSWGHFDLTTGRFPKGGEQIKELTDKARSRGIDLGVHTLTMFTSRHDPYVSPVPSDSLCKAGSTILSDDVKEADNEIYIDDPTFFAYTGPTRTVKIGKELIAYKEVSKEKPYRLLSCTRGQFGTKIANHAQGTPVDKLVNDDYSGFFPDINLQDKYAERLAEVCKETGIGLMDFDGYGGGSPGGYGCYGAGLFVDKWYKSQDQYRITCGAGTFHYYWHIYTFMNWGEPWYDNLRQSQVNYRLENQRYFERNLMPHMLGWFKLEPTYRPEDIEWIQARSAAFDAGYLLRVDESIEQSGYKSHLYEAIREWQKARNSNAFTAEQRERMKNPLNEFHLAKVSDGLWNLYDVTLKGGNEHKYRLVQAGEPLQSKFTFNNMNEEQPAQFFLYVMPGEDKSGFVRNLEITINNNDPIVLQETLKAGDKLYSDGKDLYICDSFWAPRSSLSLNTLDGWKNGKNDILVRSDFSSGKAPSLNLEFKSLGKAERIKSDNL